MTAQEKVHAYDNLVSGSEILESSLNSNLLEHINAEIALGTFIDIIGAIQWLKSTFWYVRIKSNPSHYQIAGGATGIDETLEDMCRKNVELLREHRLIRLLDGQLKITPFGDAMAKYYVRYETSMFHAKFMMPSNSSSVFDTRIATTI